MRKNTLSLSRKTLDVGKILCGIQVAPEENTRFDEWLANLGYPYVEETDNPGYADFLGEEEDESESDKEA